MEKKKRKIGEHLCKIEENFNLNYLKKKRKKKIKKAKLYN
jgi:hypothetical protein